MFIIIDDLPSSSRYCQHNKYKAVGARPGRAQIIDYYIRERTPRCRGCRGAPEWLITDLRNCIYVLIKSGLLRERARCSYPSNTVWP